jgi:transposase
MGDVSIIGLDLAKNVSQAHGAGADGSVLFRCKLSRAQLLKFMAGQPPCVMAMEACANAHQWGRVIGDLGHEVRLIRPACVKPFVKRQKMGWLRPPHTASRCAKGVVVNAPQRRGRQMKDTMIGVDLAKSVFQLHGASMAGHLKFRKKVTRVQFRHFMAKHEPAVVVMEACGSASYWAREMVKLGHEVRLIAPQYVRPFVKRQKDDAADAEAIVVAAQRPEMRFVEPKSENQQACAVHFCARERLLHQRTELVNALRSVLYENGYVFLKGIAHLRRMEAVVAETASDLPALVREECLDLLEQISEQTARIEAKATKARSFAGANDTARRLQTMPGVGPQTALAISGFAPPMDSFKRGRDFAAWLGLVPRQYTSGGKERLGRISKAGQTCIRYLLITGAMSRLRVLVRKSIQEGSWLARLLQHKPLMVVAIALANKMARAIWAMITKKEDYRDPARAISA